MDGAAGAEVGGVEEIGELIGKRDGKEEAASGGEEGAEVDRGKKEGLVAEVSRGLSRDGYAGTHVCGRREGGGGRYGGTPPGNIDDIDVLGA